MSVLAPSRDSCVVTAHDAKTGKELWRFFTIPAKGEPGDETWGNVPMNERWHVGTWMVPSYDPELNLIYVGTSVTIPAPKFILAGNDMQHLYHNCTLAINADANLGERCGLGGLAGSGGSGRGRSRWVACACCTGSEHQPYPRGHKSSGLH